MDYLFVCCFIRFYVQNLISEEKTKVFTEKYLNDDFQSKLRVYKKYARRTIEIAVPFKKQF